MSGNGRTECVDIGGANATANPTCTRSPLSRRSTVAMAAAATGGGLVGGGLVAVVTRPWSARPDIEAVAPIVTAAVLALGVRWRSDIASEGDTRVEWLGSGFLLGGGPADGTGPVRGVTAAHVALALIAFSNELATKQLSPAIVAAGAALLKPVEIAGLRVHPGFPIADRDTTRPHPTDVAVFRLPAAPLATAEPLRLSKREPAVGQIVLSAGYPHAADALVGGADAAAAKVPTLKTGRIERLILAGDGKAALLQHGLPLGGGCSGSPLVDLEGEVVGVATVSAHVSAAVNGSPSMNTSSRLLDAVGANFAIPADSLAKWVYPPRKSV